MAKVFKPFNNLSAMKIARELAVLEDIISKSSAQDILDSLALNAKFLYDNVGTPEDWANAAKYEQLKGIWDTQRDLKLISEVLFSAKHEPKIKEIYSLITEKRPEGYEYSMFYLQLIETLEHVSSLKYGSNRQKGNGVIDFSDYESAVVLFDRLLTIGPRDVRPYKRAEAVVGKEHAGISLLRDPNERVDVS